MLSAQEISMLRSPDMWRVNRMTPGLGLLALQCAVKGAGLQRVKLPPGNWFAPPGSNRSGSGGNEAVGACLLFGLEVPFLLTGGGEAILSGPTVFEALHLLGFLFGHGRGRRAAHAVAVHHARSHGLHVLLHPLHVAYQSFPHIHVVPPACHLVRILDRENVSLHLRERRLHLSRSSWT